MSFLHFTLSFLLSLFGLCLFALGLGLRFARLGAASALVAGALPLALGVPLVPCVVWVPLRELVGDDGFHLLGFPFANEAVGLGVGVVPDGTCFERRGEFPLCFR